MFLLFLIIPKFLIQASGHIPILFGTFLKLPKFRRNLDPRALYLSPKYVMKYKKCQILLKHLIFHISTSWISTKCKFWKRRAPKNEDPLKQFSEILNMGSISSREHEMNILVVLFYKIIDKSYNIETNNSSIIFY